MGNYKTRYCYWDSIIFFRKFLVTFVMSLCSSISPEISTISLLVIFYISLVNTIIFKPFKHDLCNLYEILALSCNIFTVMTSFIVNSQVNDSLRISFLTICLVSNLMIIFFCFVNMFRFASGKIKFLVMNFWGYVKFWQIKLTFQEKRI